MTSRPMLMVFCYDIGHPRVRQRVSDLLEEEAVRVQESVFEARMSRAQAESLFHRLAGLLDDGDRLRMYAVSAAGLERSMAEGGAPIPDDADHWVI
jgi:CRISPR-associated protein Cas2